MSAPVRFPGDTTRAVQANPQRQDEVNRAVYFARGVYLYYRSRAMMPVETAFLSKYESCWTGKDVLDVGAGTGRTSRFFASRTRRYVAMDYSPVMVNYLKTRMPAIDVREMDFRDLSEFADGSFDLVFATANVIDVLCHEDRRRALSESSRVLRPGGMLGFSTHNINYRAAFSGPRLEWSWNPIRFASKAAQFAIGSWNHRRIGPLRARTAEYALLNDTGHFYACLHYYVARPIAAAQLEHAGLRLLDVFDTQGRELLPCGDDRENPWLFYAAQRMSAR